MISVLLVLSMVLFLLSFVLWWLLFYSHSSSFFVASDIHCYRKLSFLSPLSLPPDSVPEPDREV